LAAFSLLGYLVTQVLTPFQQATAGLRTQLSRLEAQKSRNDATNARRTDLQARLTSLDALAAERGKVSEVLVRVQQVLGEAMSITSVSYAESGVTLQVEAPSFEAAEQYMQALRETGFFTAVSSPQQSGAPRPGAKLGISIQADLKKR
jgi:Tfp pilus assembly protein PilN